MIIDDVGFQAHLGPNRLAALDLAANRRWSYAELDLSIARCVNVLTTRFALSSGQRVASLAKNSVTLVIVHLACARCGLIYVPLNWRLSAAEIAAQLADAEPALFITDSSVGADIPGIPTASIGAPALQSLIDAASPVYPASRDDQLPSLILYTSGTSGFPKGVVLSEFNILQTAMNFGLLGWVTHESVVLVDSPMFHIIGIITTVRPPLRHGGAFVVSDGFEPSRTLKRLADPALGVTHYFCVPQMAAALRRSPDYTPAAFKGMTAIFTGGAPLLTTEVRAWLTDGVSIVNGFGMSEAGTVFGMPVERSITEAKPGSVGVAPSWVRARIVNEHDEDCADGVPGELWLRGDNIFREYWRRPDETAKAFAPGGWFRTGDIAIRDADGFFWLVDRKKDMFISGGENVYPAEIETVLAGMTGLKEFAVIGVADDQWGEVGHAILVVSETEGLDEAGIRAHLETRLARYKIPKHFSFVEALPRTGSGKILKNALRARFAPKPQTRGTG